MSPSAPSAAASASSSSRLRFGTIARRCRHRSRQQQPAHWPPAGLQGAGHLVGQQRAETVPAENQRTAVEPVLQLGQQAGQLGDHEGGIGDRLFG
jgi:hypothetical protein